MAKGTVLSFSPEMINSGPRSDSWYPPSLRSTIEVGGRRLKRRHPGGRHCEGRIEIFPLVLTHGVGEAKLFVGE
jgi:hypothetical protein